MAVIAEQLTDDLATCERLPQNEARRRIRSSLMAAHSEVLHATVNPNGNPTTAHDLAALARIVATVDAEYFAAGLPLRTRIFFQLLRINALEPAHVLAADNAVGVVEPKLAQFRWAGGHGRQRRLPLPTVVEDGHVFAWLPGFRDPRWQVPDEIYDVSRSVGLRGVVHSAVLADGQLHLAGSAYLGALTASPDDRVAVIVSGPSGFQLRVAAQRTRSPEFVGGGASGELTRLAWAGWQATIDLTDVTVASGRYPLRLEVAQQGVVRSAALGAVGGRGIARGQMLTGIDNAGPLPIKTGRGGVAYVGWTSDATQALEVVVCRGQQKRLRQLIRILVPKRLRQIARGVLRRVR